MSKPRSVVVTARKHNSQDLVVKPNRQKEKTMKRKTTERKLVVEGNAEVALNTRITGQLKLKFKKLAVTASLGLAAFAASLP